VSQHADLVLNPFHHLRMTMTDRCRENPAKAVEELTTLRIHGPGSSPSHEYDGILVQGSTTREDELLMTELHRLGEARNALRDVIVHFALRILTEQSANLTAT
jgi:hypothetical protein